MTFKRAKARVGEKSLTPGSAGPWVLSGAYDNSYQTFSYLSDGDTIEAHVIEPGAAVWTGVATYNISGGVRTITPTLVEETWGAFGTGTKEIFAGPLASRHLLREDISGAIAATFSSASVWAISSFRGFSSFAAARLSSFTFVAPVTNGAGLTINLDGTGPQPVMGTDAKPLQDGVLLSGGVYTITAYTGEWILHSFLGFPFTVPIGGMIDYFGATSPSSNFVFPFGQAINRVTYASLFSGNPWSIGTTFGAGDGVNTFNIPDLRGLGTSGKDDMGGAAAGRIGTVVTDNGTIVGTTLGSKGGSPTHALTTGEMPSHTHPNTVGETAHAHTATQGAHNTGQLVTVGSGTAGQGALSGLSGTGFTETAVAGVTISNAAQGGGAAHALLQPTMIVNKLMRII